jgi:hypothetical protein
VLLALKLVISIKDIKYKTNYLLVFYKQFLFRFCCLQLRLVFATAASLRNVVWLIE